MSLNEKSGAKNVLLLRPHGVNTISEFLCLREVGQFRLHPYHIAVWRVSNRAVDSALAAALIPVVSLTRPRSLPVEVDFYTSQALRDSASLGIALAFALLQELVDKFLLVHMHTGVDGVDDGFVVEFEIGLLRPCVLNGLEFGTVLASLLRSVHEFAEWLKRRVGAAHDVVMIAWVDCRSDEGRGFGVGAGDGKEIGTYLTVSI
jgi:hypothetical protein